jgi:hypothetical protein
MLFSMRHLELHVVETEQDIDLALQSGILTVDRLDMTTCFECDEPIGYNLELDGFEPFVVVIDDTDSDWALCLDCSAPVLDSTGKSEPISEAEWPAEDSSDDLEIF